MSSAPTPGWLILQGGQAVQVTCWGMPSVMHTTRGISFSMASRQAAPAKGGGTYMADASGFRAALASLTLLKTGSPRCLVPPFLGVTPAPRQTQVSVFAATMQVEVTGQGGGCRGLQEGGALSLTTDHVGAVGDGLLTVEGALRGWTRPASASAVCIPTNPPKEPFPEDGGHMGSRGAGRGKGRGGSSRSRWRRWPCGIVKGFCLWACERKGVPPLVGKCQSVKASDSSSHLGSWSH